MSQEQALVDIKKICQEVVTLSNDVIRKFDNQVPNNVFLSGLSGAQICVLLCHNREHFPIFFANDWFLKETGYTREQIIGRSCGFLTGPATDPAATAKIVAALQAEQPITITILNYRRDGTSFRNELFISPIHDGNNRVYAFIGIQNVLKSAQ